MLKIFLSSLWQLSVPIPSIAFLCNNGYFEGCYLPALFCNDVAL